MIAIGFLLLLIVLAIFLSVTGGGPVLGITELAVISLVFVVFFLSGIYVAAALGMLGLLADLVFSQRPSHTFLGEVAWTSSKNFLLVAVPLFLLMGEILLRSGLSDRLYRSLNNWFSALPGGLLHTNIVTCAAFSAVSGSSVATAATIGSVALPYFSQTKYKPRLVLGSLAGGGALGQLIPPGIALIVYALFTETSVGKLYSSALVAGTFVTLSFMAYIFIYSTVTRVSDPVMRVSWRTRITSLVDLVPTVILVGLVLGTIYLGLATPTESAGLGVVGALILAALDRKLNLPMLQTALRSTARSTGMIGLILLGAFSLNYVLSALRLPQMLATMVGGLPFPPWAVITIIILFYFALGTFMDGLAMMITTLPVVFPVVLALGYDPIWFGVMMTMLIEVALISPPDGMVLYVLQGMRRPVGPINDVFIGVLPFLGVYMLCVFVLIIFPDLILWAAR